MASVIPRSAMTTKLTARRASAAATPWLATDSQDLSRPYLTESCQDIRNEREGSGAAGAAGGLLADRHGFGCILTGGCAG